MASQKTIERKSKRRSAPKVDETAEPKGVKKMFQNPIVILLVVIGVVILLLLGIWGLARFLSGA